MDGPEVGDVAQEVEFLSHQGEASCLPTTEERTGLGQPHGGDNGETVTQ